MKYYLVVVSSLRSGHERILGGHLMHQQLLRYESLESKKEDGALEGATSYKFFRRDARPSRGIKRLRRLVSPLEKTKRYSSGGPPAPLEGRAPSGGVSTLWSPAIDRHGEILGVTELPRVRFFICVRAFSVLGGEMTSFSRRFLGRSMS